MNLKEQNNLSQVNSKRIAKNTIMLYVRMMVIMLVTLLTSRLVLDALGFVDYGIYNVVGGVISMLSFINNSMTISVQRYFSYEIGKRDAQGLNKIFNIAFQAHILIALMFLIIAETIGLWFVSTQLTIPKDRVFAAMWVYQSVVFSSILTITQVPYAAMIIAKEKMNIYAYLSVLDVFLKLVIVYILYLHIFDNLILYAILTMLVNSITIICYRIYVIKSFCESRILKYWNIHQLKELFSFASWSMLGEIAWAFTGQGVNILLNIFFGPVINAARGISSQVDAAVRSFVQGFQTAVNPQLIKSYAADEIKEMLHLLYRSIRFSYFLLFLLALPLIIEMDFVLGLWLKSVPKHAVLFCRLSLICSLVDTLSNLLTQIPRASGKVRNYQMVVSTILLLNFPISYIVLKCGAVPEITLVVYLCISLLLLFSRFYMCKRLIDMSVSDFCYSVLKPVVKVTSMSIIISLLMAFCLHGNWIYSLLNILVIVVSTLLFIVIFGINREEYIYVKNIVIGLKKKIF